MRRVFQSVFATLGGFLLIAPVALANEATGKPPDYSGISYMYYTLIGIILVYGVYDTFFKKSS